MFHTRLRAKLSRAVPLWNRTVKSVVVVEMRRPTFLLITTHRDSRICKTTANMSSTDTQSCKRFMTCSCCDGHCRSVWWWTDRCMKAKYMPIFCLIQKRALNTAILTDSRVSIFSCTKEAMSFQSRMSTSQLFCLWPNIFWPRWRPWWVVFWRRNNLSMTF